TADRNRSHWSTSKTPSYTKSVSWQHYLETYMDGVHLICTTAKVDRSFGDIPLVHGMPFISGVGIEALQNKILTILQG
ncbi:PTS galactitol transporter subunit IIB, partial [Escherichia coli]|uniref:PTS galactitol transporter subunit IIB n=1 Tax=Escherichia coli TaxID=562 RepID=UPI0025784A6B